MPQEITQVVAARGRHPPQDGMVPLLQMQILQPRRAVEELGVVVDFLPPVASIVVVLRHPHTTTTTNPPHHQLVPTHINQHLPQTPHQHQGEEEQAITSKPQRMYRQGEVEAVTAMYNSIVSVVVVPHPHLPPTTVPLTPAVHTTLLEAPLTSFVQTAVA